MLRIIVTTFLVFVTSQTFSQPASLQYLQLKDRLDRLNDGYCLDVVGSGKYMRLDMPLTAHNCKGPQIYYDEVVQYRNDKTLYFPSYDRCVTVMGINDRALSGNALMLKGCGVEEPFLNAKNFQKFEFNSKGQLQLVGSHLCMAAGTESHTTYSLEHRWRSLLMLPCTEIELSRSVWQIVNAGNN
ncbi:MAG: RICIN domain-containing protein [Alphaproteobacteria bacterium]|nr:RICIN domain-containing protein [Alphaproteobacteria bacterium]